MSGKRVTMTDLQHLRELCEKATPGPWESTHGPYNDLHFGHCGSGSGVEMPTGSGFFTAGFPPDDAEFIAAARTALPLLIQVAEAATIINGDGLAPREAWLAWGRMDDALTALEREL